MNRLLSNLNPTSVFFIAYAIVLLYYTPSLFFEFGYSDDYHSLYALRYDENWAAAAAEMGRPIQGRLVDSIFSWAKDVAGLAKIRALSYLILGLISYLFYTEWAKVFNSDKVSAAVLSILPLFVPAFEIISVWPSTFPALISFTLSLIGGKLLSTNNSSIKIKLTYWLIGFILLFIALQTYQATLAACFIPWLIRSINSSDIKLELKKLAIPSVGFLVANIGYYTWFKWYQSTENTSNRTELVSDIGDKIVWFVEQPLKLSFASFAALESDGVRKALIIFQLVVILAGLFLLLRKKNLSTAISLFFIWVLSFPIAYYTGLIAAESWPSYRTQTVLSFVAVFTLGAALKGWINESKRWMLSSAYLVVFFFFGAKHLYPDFVLLQTHDWKKLQENINQQEVSNQYATGDTIYLVRPERIVGWNKGFIKQFGVDETGIPSTAVEWATEPMINLIKEDIWISPKPDVQIKLYNPTDSTEYQKQKKVIMLEDNFDNY